MPFLKRLGYFLIGLSIGLIFLAVFLRKKTSSTDTEFCYLPNCRVLKELRSKPMQIDPGLSTPVDTVLVQYVLREGEVDFDKSDPRAEPCKIYRVHGSKADKELQMTLHNCAEYTLITAYSESGQ